MGGTDLQGEPADVQARCFVCQQQCAGPNLLQLDTLYNVGKFSRQHLSVQPGMLYACDSLADAFKSRPGFASRGSLSVS